MEHRHLVRECTGYMTAATPQQSENLDERIT